MPASTRNSRRSIAAGAGLRAARLLGAEDGIALIMAVLIVMVLGLSAAGAIEVVRANQVSSARERQASRALNAAEGGLDTASNTVISTEASTPQATGATLSGSQTVDGNSVSWTASKGSSSAWTVTATATSPSGTVKRVLQRQVSASSTTITGAASPVYAYGFFMGDPAADCTTIADTTKTDNMGNSAYVTVPVYIASSLCTSGGSNPLIANPSSGSPITLYVGGKFTTSGNSSPVGTSASPLASATIVGGCQISFHGTKYPPCDQQGVPTSGTGSGVWASTYSSTAQTLTKPVVGNTEADAEYQNASPGPNHPCGAGSTVGLFKLESVGSTTRDTSLGTVNLLHLKNTNQSDTGNNFDCKTYDGSGNLIGELKWADGSPGTLTILGTVFIDGNLNFSNNDAAVYSGTGTIYVDGTVSFANGNRLCGAPMVGSTCSGNWDPTANSLEIVAINHQGVNTGWTMGGDAEFEGIAYANGHYQSGNSAWVQGPVIADSGTLSGATNFKAISNPPPGAPGASTSITTTTWGVAPGSWRECPSSTGC